MITIIDGDSCSIQVRGGKQVSSGAWTVFKGQGLPGRCLCVCDSQAGLGLGASTLVNPGHVSRRGSGGQTPATLGIVALKAHSLLGMGAVTHCDHDRVPGGREDVCVIVALIMLGELLGEELTGELGAEEEGD